MYIYPSLVVNITVLNHFITRIAKFMYYQKMCIEIQYM